MAEQGRERRICPRCGWTVDRGAADRERVLVKDKDDFAERLWNALERERVLVEALDNYLSADEWVMSAYAAAGTSPDEQADAEANLREKREAARAALEAAGEGEDARAAKRD